VSRKLEVCDDVFISFSNKMITTIVCSKGDIGEVPHVSSKSAYVCGGPVHVMFCEIQ
jgi:hypothetical protein